MMNPLLLLRSFPRHYVAPVAEPPGEGQALVDSGGAVFLLPSGHVAVRQE